MGYKGEKASLNQYTALKEYLENSGAIDQIKKVYALTEEFREKLKSEDSELAQPVFTDKKTPILKVLAIDAGMAKFFKDTPYEVVVIKTAGGFDGENTPLIDEVTKPSYSHVFTGLVKNPRVFASITNKGDTAGSALLAAEEIMRLFEDSHLSKLNDLMNEIFDGSFSNDITKWVVKLKKLPEIDNLTRELSEWYYVLRAATKLKDVLIVKDGSLITNQFGSGQSLAQRLHSIFSGEIESVSPLIVGVVKESRFLKDENHVVSNVIHNFSKSITGSAFFEVPFHLETIMDPTPLSERSVKRLFLSVFSGQKVFEVQFPMILAEDDELFEQARNTILNQVTALFGGSVYANTLAHKAASLSESEARALEQALRTKVEDKKK